MPFPENLVTNDPKPSVPRIFLGNAGKQGFVSNYAGTMCDPLSENGTPAVAGRQASGLSISLTR
jgi:hypothetical protein